MGQNNGYIYILTNPSFPQYVKIGYADDVEKRLAQLNRSECVPFAFQVYATYEVNSRLSDVQIHKLIDKINPNLRAIEFNEGKKRVREFYAMSPVFRQHTQSLQEKKELRSVLRDTDSTLQHAGRSQSS